MALRTLQRYHGESEAYSGSEELNILLHSPHFIDENIKSNLGKELRKERRLIEKILEMNVVSNCC